MAEPTAATPPQHHESPVRRVLVESALIVFSILLALAVNSWSDARKQHAQTERALTAVRDEISNNAKLVAAKVPYHRLMIAATKRADSGRLVHSYADFLKAAPSWSGFENPEYDATAWQSAITLGAVSNMGFDTVRTLSRLYAAQAKIDAYASNVTDFADATMPSTVRKMYVYFATVATNEDTLANRYAEALRMLGKAPAR